MKLVHKIMLLPALAVVAFLLVFLVFSRGGRVHQDQLNRIGNDYIKAFYLSVELRSTLID